MKKSAVFNSVNADAGYEKEARFVMNSPLSELAADQSIPMSRISALPVARNLPIAALVVQYNLVQPAIHGSAIGYGSI